MTEPMFVFEDGSSVPMRLIGFDSQGRWYRKDLVGPGGYRPPENPAPVSGPGALSRRTDGGPGDSRQPIRDLPDARYGENRDFVAQQEGAPLPEAGGPNPPSPSQIPQMSERIRRELVPLNAPSQRPHEPVMSGARIGAGRNADYTAFPGLQVQPGELSEVVRQHAAADPTGILSMLVEDLMEMGL